MVLIRFSNWIVMIVELNILWLEERYNIENSGSLLKRLEREISAGNFVAEASFQDSTSRGTVNLDGEVFEVVISNQTSRIIHQYIL